MQSNSKISYLTFAFIIYVSVVNVFPQISDYDKPILIKRFTVAGSSVDSMSEYGFEIAKILKADSDLNLVIRLCSTEKLSIAAGTSAVDPVLLTWFLMNTENFPKFSVDRIFVELSATCQKSGSLTIATELWIIPKLKLPESKKITACRLRSFEYKSYSDVKQNIAVGTKKYKAAFAQLNQDIKSGQQDSGLVIAYHNTGSIKSVLKKLNSLHEYSKIKKLNLKNLFFAQLDWNKEDTVGEIKNIVIKAVGIVPECADKGILPEIIYIN